MIARNLVVLSLSVFLYMKNIKRVSFYNITTVGYGDFYPVTLSGRILAIVLMVFGVGLFGVFTAYVASLFIEGEDEGKSLEILKEIKLLRAEIQTLKKEK